MDFGISGKILRLQQFVDPRRMIEDEIRRGVKTIVIVGNDDTFAYVLSKAATIDTTFGFIPVGPNNSMAEVLGIPSGDGACDVLSKRRIESLDIGTVSNKNKYFIAKLEIPAAAIAVSYDDLFTASSSTGLAELIVTNLIPYEWNRRWSNLTTVRPQDRQLDAFFRPLVKHGVVRKVLEDPSVFQFRILEVESIDGYPFEVYIDGHMSKEKHIVISMAKERIRVIVGRDRQF